MQPPCPVSVLREMNRIRCFFGFYQTKILLSDITLKLIVSPLTEFMSSSKDPETVSASLLTFCGSLEANTVARKSWETFSAGEKFRNGVKKGWI